jgi:carboxylate-amine ligase
MAATHSASDLRAVFDAPAPLTVGLEEELMLLDAGSLDLAPAAMRVLEGLDSRFKAELPAAQLEIVTTPVATVGEAIAQLAASRRDLAAACGPGLRPAAGGMHPFAAPLGELNTGARYDVIAAEYASIARRQLVCALQVHVAVGGADRTLAVYNGLRSYLPLLAALAANAPFHDGEDTGLASMRPVVGRMLPRQGMPPALESWEAFAEALRWVGDPNLWWWELRPHPRFGTLELRVPDAQTHVEEAAAVAAVVHALVAWLAERHDSGERLASDETWRIEENRWSACRHGVEGDMADLATGDRAPTRELLSALIDELVPVAQRVGCARELAAARPLIERNGAMRLRDLGPHDAARAMADGFTRAGTGITSAT